MMDDTGGLDAAVAGLIWLAVGVVFATVVAAWTISSVAARPRGVTSFGLALAARR